MFGQRVLAPLKQTTGNWISLHGKVWLADAQKLVSQNSFFFSKNVEMKIKLQSICFAFLSFL